MTQPRTTAGPRTARLINDRAAYDLLLERGPLSRAELQTLTGLSRPTVGELVDRLEAAGVVAPVGASSVRRRGPAALLYGVVADRAHVAGVEVRPDAVLASVTDVTGRQAGAARLPHDRGAAPDALVHRAVAAALADAGLAEERLHVLVIGTPGLVDPDSGDVGFVGALPTWHANLLPGLRRRLGIPVVVENEVNLIGVAEQRLGAARGEDGFALIALGEGIGMAVVLDGRLHRGASGGAGELSYLPAAPDGRRFPDLAAGEAVRELARAHGWDGDAADAVHAAADAVGGAEARAGRDGAGTEASAGTGGDGTEDGGPPRGGRAAPAAPADFLDTLADRVALGAAGVCAVLDPGFVVLAGPVGRAGGAPLARRVEERLTAALPLPTRVAPGTVSGYPVVRGAVTVALGRLHEATFTAG